MRWSFLLILAGVCLSFCPLAQRSAAQPSVAQPTTSVGDAVQPSAAQSRVTQSDILQQPITLNYRAATLRQILHNISDRYRIQFAYLNNEMPEAPTFSIQARDQALGLVLDELLETTPFSYQVVNEQIVLKKEPNRVPPASATRSGEARHPFAEEDSSDSATTAVPPVRRDRRKEKIAPSPGNASVVQRMTVANSPQYPSRKIPSVASHPIQETAPNQAFADQITMKPVAIDSDAAEPTHRSASEKRKEKGARERTSPWAEKISRNVRRAIDKLLRSPSPDSADYLYRPFHLGLIYPLSTNGRRAGKTVNQVSFHLLVGYAAGLDGAEFSAVGNLENDFVEGAQFAGFFNLVRRRVNGLQAAGFVNANGGHTRGAQLSGFVNVGAGEITGLQATGFVNVATEAQRGAQLSGFVNLLTDSLRGVQGTGFVNVATGGTRGAQLSGFVNYTHHLRGLQATGFVNVASGDVQGAQLSGFVNYAHYVRGAQIGLFNVADSINGVPIGLVSIVRKNGYRRLELWYGDAMQANIAFKMGVAQFYNMLVVSTQFADSDVRWGAGYGVGTLLPITSAFSMNLDLFAMQIHEDDQRFFDNYALNLLSTLRLSLNLHLAKHLALFAAPTFNVMVSEYRQPDTGAIGSAIVPSRTVYDETFDGRTNVSMWPGFHVGLRF